DFSIRLTEKFPKLTDSERRLTTLLRLGFSTKYIATLMNISPKSVEIGRHRLRAKLGLDRQQNLVAFVKTI
ncbi:MAG: LuxR C-terminal-related transcriptional regulator, partial [Alistipes sp.]|nr:LuxR C-terminal-related transcriptional regulator [Alistipes sp.]